ncbi:mCG6078, isoform CRA_a [Mus musculus]|nr:mCG6078, isoform CRA_a [Mus musculus]
MPPILILLTLLLPLRAGAEEIIGGHEVKPHSRPYMASMTVTLGAHNIKAKEETQQIIPVAKAIPHPLESKAKRTKAVRPLKLPRPNARVKPGDVCSVAGWGKTSINATKASARLREAQLIIQEDEECKKLWVNRGDPSCVTT